MKNKRMILEMLYEQQINVEEALDLLEALQEEVPEVSKKAKWLKVEVDSGEDKVKVKLPLGVVKAMFKLGGKKKISGVELDDESIQQIMEALQSGKQGDVIIVQSKEGQNVRIFLE